MGVGGVGGGHWGASWGAEGAALLQSAPQARKN